MSGVRCRNEERLALGLTLPGFVERSKVIASLPGLGLLTSAGAGAAAGRGGVSAREKKRLDARRACGYKGARNISDSPSP